jgi:hypothetical protein
MLVAIAEIRWPLTFRDHQSKHFIGTLTRALDKTAFLQGFSNSPIPRMLAVQYILSGDATRESAGAFNFHPLGVLSDKH